MRIKSKPGISGQSKKLINLFIFNLVFCTLIVLPPGSEANYNIYLTNGKVITEVEEIKKEAGKIKILKYGIELELTETSVIRIEEYEGTETAEEETAKEKEATSGKELPGNLRYEAPSSRGLKSNTDIKLQQAKNRYQSILNKLEKIDELEKRSNELQWESRKKWSPRKARIAKQEKENVDRELESLKKEQDWLLEQKKELESQIDSLERQ